MCRTIAVAGRGEVVDGERTPCITSAISCSRPTSGAHAEPRRHPLGEPLRQRRRADRRPSRVAESVAGEAREPIADRPARPGSPCRRPTPPGARRPAPTSRPGGRAARPTSSRRARRVVNGRRCSRQARGRLHASSTGSTSVERAQPRLASTARTLQVSPPAPHAATCSPSSAHTWQVPHVRPTATLPRSRCATWRPAAAKSAGRRRRDGRSRPASTRSTARRRAPSPGSAPSCGCSPAGRRTARAPGR